MSEIPACYQDSILFWAESCLALANSCSSISFNYLMIFPVKVDFPESTWPMNTIFAFDLAKKLVLRYLLESQSNDINFWMLIYGSPWRIITFYCYSTGCFFSFTSLRVYCLLGLLEFCIFLSYFKSPPFAITCIYNNCFS
jgi:hypothetical protein